MDQIIIDYLLQKDLPTVSIWCLVYNHEHYLRKCLDGFVKQITTFPVEAIVHDDASTDNSASIIMEYASKYPHIIKPIIETENQSSKKDGSLDLLFKKTMRGKYIAICEGDDYWTDPYKLQKQVDYLENNSSVNIATHNAIRAFSDGKEEPFNKDVKSQVYSLKQCLYKGWFTPTASFLFRNNFELSPLWNKNGSNGDMAFLYSNLMRGDLYYSNEVMSVYNYGTPYSMTKKTPRAQLYAKKRGTLKTINQLSNKKYLILTLPSIISLYIKQFIWSLLSGLKFVRK